jgi:cation-transporting ATPase V/Cu+-exporting ATPase
MTDTAREPAAPSGTDQLDFEVEGMTCGSCAVRVQRVLGRQPGVASAEVNFATGKARVASEGPVEVGGLQAAVERIGYRIRPVEPGRKAEDAEARAEEAWRRRLVVAVPLAVALVALALWPGGAMEQPWGRLTALLRGPGQGTSGPGHPGPARTRRQAGPGAPRRPRGHGAD